MAKEPFNFDCVNDFSEKWKDVIGYKGFYLVSNKGRIKSIKRMVSNGRHGKRLVKERVLNLNNDKDGYKIVSLSKKGKVATCKVHRIVAQSFLGIDNDKHFVNHKDGNKSNNHIDNLEWVTQLQNHKHASLNGLKSMGSNHYRSKITESDVLIIRELKLHGALSNRQIAEKYNVSKSAIEKIGNGATWKHI